MPRKKQPSSNQSSVGIFGFIWGVFRAIWEAYTPAEPAFETGRSNKKSTAGTRKKNSPSSSSQKRRSMVPKTKKRTRRT